MKREREREERGLISVSGQNFELRVEIRIIYHQGVPHEANTSAE